MANLTGHTGLSRLYIWAAVAATAAGFSGIWFVMAGILPTFSDEQGYVSAAKGILLTGKPFLFNFDSCQLTSTQYLRGLEITQLTAWSERIFGESLRSARIVPFAFTIGTWLLYVVYTQWRGYSSAKQILVVSLLFFGQTMVLEKALYVAVYAPLLFFLLLALIATWELFNFWRTMKIPLTVALIGIVVVSLGITRWWHIVQFAVFLLAIVTLWMAIYRLPVRNLLHQGWQRLISLPVRWRYPAFAILFILVAATIPIGPRAVDLIGSEILGLRPSFAFGRNYHSLIAVIPWDNVVGLIRFLLVTNVLLILWWKISKADGTGRDFNSWIIATGIISGILIAVFMNHSGVFWTRHLLISAGLVALGASPRVADLPNRYTLGAVLAIYLLMNGLVSANTFYFDRHNIDKAIDWLEINAEETDLILSNGVDLYLNGGEQFCGRTTSVTKPLPPTFDANELRDLPLAKDRTGYMQPSRTHAPYMSADSLKEVLEENTSVNVYFLYKDTYEFRDTLYRWTTGRERLKRTDIFALLRDADVGPEVDLKLRASGLKRIDKKKLLDALAARGQ